MAGLNAGKGCIDAVQQSGVSFNAFTGQFPLFVREDLIHYLFLAFHQQGLAQIRLIRKLRPLRQQASFQSSERPATESLTIGFFCTVAPVPGHYFGHDDNLTLELPRLARRAPRGIPEIPSPH
jgi:hypothetical protein